MTEPEPDKYEESKDRLRYLSGGINYENSTIDITWGKTNDAMTALGDLVRNETEEDENEQ